MVGYLCYPYLYLSTFIQAAYRPYKGLTMALWYRQYTDRIQAVYKPYTGRIKAVYRLSSGRNQCTNLKLKVTPVI